MRRDCHEADNGRERALPPGGRAPSPAANARGRKTVREANPACANESP